MTSYMTIMVRVVSNKAQAQLAALRAQQAGLSSGIAAAGRQEPLGRRHITSLMKFGNQLQWTGRMLQYNFSLPLLAAGAAATHFALEQEKAFIHVSKVYGDTDAAAKQFRREMGLGRKAAMDLANAYKTDELEALDRAFTAISEHYGVQKKEVNEVAGAWAAAGASGLDLAESVNQTMQAIIIGDMAAGDATKALISIQAQYNLSTQELQATLANLNSVENQTGASMGDLIVGFEKAAGVARSAGVETNQLAAYMAALVPATGSAATAGNALKTIFSRLLSPTKETTQVLGAMGINVKELDWQSATINERLQIMATKFQGLGKAAQGAASSVIASRWQVNRFEVLMRELVSTTGYYAKALEAADNQGESFRRMQDELNTVLESDPRKLQRMLVMLQNASVEVIQPLIPHIIYLADRMAALAKSFAALDPHTQKLILFLLAILAAIGPVVRYLGALTTLFGVFSTAISHALGFIMLLTKALLWPIVSIVRLMGYLGTLFTTMVSGSAAAVAGFGKSMVGRLGAAMLMANRMVITHSLIPLFGAMWAGVLSVFKMGTAAAFTVQTGFNTASVTEDAAALGWRERLFALGAAARIKAEQIGAAGAAAADAAGNAATAGSDLVTINNRQAMWEAFLAWRIGRARAWNAANYGLEAGASASMLALETSRRSVSVAGYSAYYTWLLAQIRAHWATRMGLEASGNAAVAALESSSFATRMAAWEAFLAWRIGLARAWNAANYGLEAGAAAGLIALESSKNATLVAMNGAAGGVMVAQNATVAGTVVTVNAAGAAATVSVWAKARLRIMAIFASLLTFIPRVFALIGVIAGRVIPLLLGPWGIAIAAIVGLLWHFRDDVARIWKQVSASIGDTGTVIGQAADWIRDRMLSAFNALPQGVQNAMVAVVTIVRDAALAVYDWFSYINPWAHHSPSLVENVTTGMDTIVGKFARLGEIKKYTTAAYNEIKRFGELTANVGLNATAAQRKDDRKSLKDAGAGKALASYDRLTKLLDKLNPLMDRLAGKVATQQKVVDKWQTKVDEANKALDAQQDKLDRLQAKLDKYQQKLQDAQSSLDYYASAPLVGMQDMENQIFANTMAQNKLKLAMMDMEDAVGPLDQIREKMDSINGLQEIFRGEQASLRAAGAGSEILGQYDDEISKLEDQKTVYNEAAEKIDFMRLELEKLQREAERLDLVKSLKFDELQHQIELAADSTKELSFDEIMAGIAGANDQIAKYGPLVDEATQAVADQQKVVDEATKTRDAYQQRLDAETDKLNALQQKYQDVADTIRDIESAISDVLDSASKLNDIGKKKDKAKADKSEYISPGLQNFLDAGKADFPDPGGSGIPPRSDWSNQAGDIDKFTEQLTNQTTDMFKDLNPFLPLKEKALAVWDWIKEKGQVAAGAVKDAWGNVFTGGGGTDKIKNAAEDIKAKVEPIVEFLTGVSRDIAKWAGHAWDLIWPAIKKIGEGIWDGLKSVWERVGPKIEEFGKLWGPFGEAIKNAWEVAKPFLALLTGELLMAISGLLGAIGEAIGPAIEAIGRILGGFIDIVRGVVEIIIGIFTGDLSMILDGVRDIFVGLWDIIAGIVGGGVRVVWNLIQGFVIGIYDFFVWLWDVLVGHSIVPDIINGVLDWFGKLGALAQWVWDNVLKPVYDFFKSLWTDHLSGYLSTFWDKITGAWAALKQFGNWVWNNILKPVKDFFVDLWSEHVQPKLGEWWENIKLAWALLTGLAGWVWDNVLKPVFDNYADLWTVHIQPKLAGWWDNIKNVWSSLTGLGDWVTTNVMDPVKNAFTNGWQSIKTWFLDHADILTNPVSTVVNTVIGAVNTMIKGLNKVADVLPGADWNIGTITPITLLEQGGPIPGRSASRGFMTRGARAIVGEGKANYPEFVIPTDPTHRNRAKGLLAMAAQKIGLGDASASIRNAQMLDEHGIPMFGIGGWLGDRWQDTKNLGEKLADMPKKAIGAVMDKVLDEAAGVVNKIGWQPIESPPESVIEKLRSWVTEADTKVAEKLDSMVPAGGSVPVADPASPGGQRYWGGGLFTNRFVAHMEKAQQLAGSSIGVIQGGFRPATSYSGTSHQGDALDMQVNYSLLKALRQVGIAAGDRTGLGDWSPHIHAVPGPSSGYGAGSAPWQWSDYIARGGAAQSATSPWGLKSGGIARRGSNADIRVGDGRYDEAVVPLPYGWQNLRGGGGDTKTFNFYGDLEFPNVTSGDDASAFLDNLEILAKD